MRSLAWMAVLAAVAYAATTPAAKKNDDLDCMFLGYPELEYDGYDRTEVTIDNYLLSNGSKSIPLLHSCRINFEREKIQKVVFVGAYGEELQQDSLCRRREIGRLLQWCRRGRQWDGPVWVLPSGQNYHLLGFGIGIPQTVGITGANVENTEIIFLMTFFISGL